MKLRIASALLLVLPATGLAQGVQRCETPDGKVTYSNTRCPDGSSAVRQVNTTPPVAVDEAKAAKDRARDDAARARELDKAKLDEDARERKVAEQKQASDAKSDAAARTKERERCDKARRELARARDVRADLTAQGAASISDMQKADREVTRREGALKGCPGG